MDWIDLAQNRERWREFVNAVMNLQVPQRAGKLEPVSFSRGTLLHEASKLYTVYARNYFFHVDRAYGEGVRKKSVQEHTRSCHLIMTNEVGWACGMYEGG
jgi:hypothetical protein